jgi:hypothetical protein
MQQSKFILLIDVISVINQGIDTDAAMTVKQEKTPAIPTTTTTADVVAIHDDRAIPKEEDLIESLAQITNRERKDIEGLLTRLHNSAGNIAKAYN